MRISGSRRCTGNNPAARATGWCIALLLREALTIAALWTALGLVQPGVAAEPGDDLKTREKICTDTAADWFKKNWPDGKASTHNSESTATYVNHFHTKREKCFMLVVVNEVSYSWQGTLRTITKQLIDPDAKGAYATFRETNGAHALCIIEGHVCKTTAQWDMLVRGLYLEDEAAIAETQRRQ